MQLENNKMIDIKMLNSYFQENQVYVPIIQRNYKWPAKTPEKKPEINSAEKLAKDLWISFLESEKLDNKYTIGMITLYPEQSEQTINRIQLIDGQQRVISLKLLLKVIDVDNNDFNLDFERDEGLEQQNTRKHYLDNYLGKQGNYMVPSYPDISRFKENYNAIHSYLNEQDDFEQKKDDFKNYIFNNVFILFHLTEVEPIDEFLNINKNKTRFTICDYIKAQLIIDATGNNERIEILEMFVSLAKYLFLDDIWKIVSLGYTPKAEKEEERNIQLCYPDENRLKVLFSDRYSGNSKLGYQKEKEKKRLKHYRYILDTLCLDIAQLNYNQSNGFQCYYNVSTSKKRFFELFNKQLNLSKQFEEVLFDKIRKENIFVKNCFIQSQLSGENKFIEIEDLKKENDQQGWLCMAKDSWDDFAKYYEQYVVNKYQKGEESKVWR